MHDVAAPTLTLVLSLPPFTIAVQLTDWSMQANASVVLVLRAQMTTITHPGATSLQAANVEIENQELVAPGLRLHAQVL